MVKFSSGQVVLFKGKGVYSSLIRLANKIHYPKSLDRDWTHAGIISVVDESLGTVLIGEALNDGFVESTFGIGELNTLIQQGKAIIGTPKQELDDVELVIQGYLGSPYGWLNILHIAIYTITGKTAFKFLGAKDLICSEVVCRVLYDCSNKKIDFTKEFGKPYDIITPQDLYVSKQIVWDKQDAKIILDGGFSGKKVSKN